MGIFARFRAIWLFLLLTACDNDFFPAGIYDYQVERLLTAGDSKVWSQVISSQSCQDSVQLFLELVSSSSDDSVAISEIFRGPSCDPDTNLIGNADASSFEGAIIFTDSLNLSDGDFWIIEEITSNILRVRRGGEVLNYVF